MYVSKLHLSNFRNFKDATFYFEKNINFVLGNNGVGKTSLLESLYYLCVAKSFRNSSHVNIINIDSDQFILNSIFNDKNLISHKLNISRNSKGDLVVKCNDEYIRKVSSLASLNFILPLTFKKGDTIFDIPPQKRREFLDCGCFYNYKDYICLINNYKNILKNRNLILQSRKFIDSLFIWNKLFCETVTSITIARQNYLKELSDIFQNLILFFFQNLNEKISISYYSGYKEKLSLEEQLDMISSKELALGVTCIGPHKADFIIKIGDINAIDFLSRGQKKIFSIVLRFAQGLLYSKISNDNCIFLLDDLGSELDYETIEKIFQFIENSIFNKHQFIITMINDTRFNNRYSKYNSIVL